MEGKQMCIAIACDHAGYTLKEQIKDYFSGRNNIMIKDLGTYSDESVDYPDYGHKLANEIEKGNCHMGITICGSGNGINMTANKHQMIRSALCWSEEIARLARAHNDANVCALPGRFIDIEQALVIVERFLQTDFDGGRHERRKKKIPVRNYR